MVGEVFTRVHATHVNCYACLRAGYVHTYVCTHSPLYTYRFYFGKMV